MTDTPARLDAFISYSRRDLEFATRLRQELSKRERSTWIDLEGIPPTAEWWEEVRQAIRRGANFVFVLSPDAVASPVCQRELAYALDCGKRVIPLLARETRRDLPEAIAKVQWIDFLDSRGFEAACEVLVRAFDTDLEMVRWHTRVLTRAYDWDQRARDRSLLLRGAELREALARLETGDRKEPRLNDLQRTYIDASHHDDRARNRRRFVISSLTLALLAALAAYGGWQLHRRSKERLSEEIAARARSALADNALASLMMSLDALEEAQTPAALQALSSALSVSRVRGTLLGRAPETVAAAFLPDGTALATLGKDGTVELWATETKLSLGHAAAPVTDPSAISFSASGHRVFVTGGDGLCAWRVPDLDPVGCWRRDPLLAANHTPNGESVLLSGVGLEYVDIGGDGAHPFPGLETTTCGAVAVSADGRVMAVAILPDRSPTSGTVLLLRDAGGRMHGARTHPTRGLPRLALSANGTRVLTVDDQNTVMLSDTAGGARLYTSARPGRVRSASFSPAGHWMVVADESRRITVLDADKAGTAADFEIRDPRLGTLTVVTLLNEIPWIVAGGSSGLAVVYDRKGRELFALSGGSKFINGLAVSPDARTALTFGEEDLLWDLTPTSARSVIPAHEGSVETVRFTGDGRSLVTGGADGQVRLWQLDRPAEPALLAQHSDWVMAAAPLRGPGRRVFSAGLDGVVRIVDLDAAAGEWQQELHRAHDGDPDQAGWISDVAIAPSGDELTTVGQDGALVRLGLRPPKTLRRRAGDGTPLTAVAYATGGTSVAVGDERGRVFVLRYDSGEERPLRSHDGPVVKVAFSPDGRRLLSVSADATARIFDTGTWAAPIEVTGHQQPLITGGFSPDGRWIVTAGFDTAVRIWGSGSGGLVRELDGHLDAVKVASFVTASRVVTGSSDGRLRVWDVPGGRLLAMMELQTEIRALDATSDGRLLAIALGDGRVVLWPCPLCGEVEQAIAAGYRTAAPLVAQLHRASATPAGSGR